MSNASNTNPASTVTITVATALRQLKYVKGELSNLAERAVECVSWPQDKPPVFNFNEVCAETEAYRAELIELETAVAIANANTMLECVLDGQSTTVAVAYAIRVLQEYKNKISLLKKLPLKSGSEEKRETAYDNETGRPYSSKVTTVFVSALTEPERARQADQLQKRYIQLNNVLEAANHRTTITVSAPRNQA